MALGQSAGMIAVRAGSECLAGAGQIAGDQVRVQANITGKDTVWDAMAKACRTADGELAGRGLVDLEAAGAEGGDIRGTQSASLLVVAAESSGQPWKDRSYDLRIEDHATPIPEMRRLVRLRRAYLHMTAGDEALGRGSMDEALDQYARAENLFPEVVEIPF